MCYVAVGVELSTEPLKRSQAGTKTLIGMEYEALPRSRSDLRVLVVTVYPLAQLLCAKATQLRSNLTGIISISFSPTGSVVRLGDIRCLCPYEPENDTYNVGYFDIYRVIGRAMPPIGYLRPAAAGTGGEKVHESVQRYTLRYGKPESCLK
ncbi:uncharacterized protein NECHADRAFT_84072 [Fusarium vanettenii 77-13-4]|uniref:Uncharacterized protein n=1 Tax=Fusarium vanettenii (strain ATCC MYA-4622 / CBS 123669 / FGSC 9596 / NRRL 45880 / 77-13-4) TaxID=660122 RepID=C7YZL7_FUSV7|nr:uncharacterized protein NECHADRAFT_84072 [Fusarium vanettenii 77-13-4]EEU42627.1 predicted protein [Fusarium vanettenii 77-13-4]